MRNDYGVLEKDVQVGDICKIYTHQEMFPAKCIANNGKTLKFEFYVAPKALQVQYGRPLVPADCDFEKVDGRMATYGNWRIDIPFGSNRESFTTYKDIVSRRISKKGYHIDVYPQDKLDELTYTRLGADPYAN